MRLTGVELRWLDLHLRAPHRSAWGGTDERPVVLVRVVADGAEGWGECAALAAPTYTEEYAAGAYSVLERELIPHLLQAVAHDGGELPEPDEAGALLCRTRGHPSAKAAIEMALLDLQLRAAGRSLADRLWVTAEWVEAGAVVGVTDPDGPGQLQALLDEVDALVDAGFERIKLKILPGADVKPLMALRERFGKLALQADANGSYRIDDPGHVDALLAMDDLDLLCIEQPLEPDDLVDHAALARRLRTPVCLDESISSPGRLEDALALNACDVACLKPSRLGGLLPAVAAHDRCRSAGVPVWAGGMLETTLARSANAALAGLPGFTLPGDLSVGDRFVEGDPFLAGGEPSGGPGPACHVPVHRGPGVGPAPDPEALERVTTRVAWFAAAGDQGRRPA